MTIYQNKLRIIQKVIFSQKFEKRQILRKGFNLIETIFLCQTCEMGQLLPKIVLLLKMSHYSLTKLFWCFEAILQKLAKKLFI